MASGGSNLSANFKSFATKASGKECTSKDMTRWFKDCVGFGKCMTSNSLDIAYSAVKKTKPGLTIDMMPDLIARMAKDYAKDKKCTEDDAKTQLQKKLATGGKESHGTTKTANKSTTDKMTDASKYTGAHKERFGADGKGKGLEGREDKADNSGYVGNYKGADTFDQKK